MKKNKKMLFLAVAFVTILILLSAVNATDDTDKSIDNAISEKTSSTTSSEIKETTTKNAKIVKDTSKEQSFTNNVKENKEIKKDNKTDENKKTTSKTVNINNMDEFTSTINNAVNDPDNDEYIINLNEGTYTFSSNILFEPGNHQKNIIINGENQTISGSSSSRRIVFSNNCNITINNLTINCRIRNGYNLTINNSRSFNDFVNFENANLIINNSIISDNSNQAQLTNEGMTSIYNSTLNGITIDNYNTMYVSDDTNINNIKFLTIGTIETTNTDLINILSEKGVYLGNNTIKNTVVNNNIINSGNLTISNSTLNSQLTNNGILIINDDVIFGENFILKGDGQIIINDTSKILPYITQLNGNYTIENQTFNKGFKFYGNITLINCLFNEEGYVRSYSNYGILYLKNCTINISNSIKNYNIMVIDADTQIISGDITENGTIFYGDIPEGYFDQPTEYNGENTQENMNLVRPFTNNGNLTLLNCTISTKITNQGNITLRNSNISELITNIGTITFINCSFSNNNMIKSQLSPSTGYLLDNKGIARLENCFIENNTFNYTGSTSSNVNLGGAIINNGIMTVVDTVARNNSLGYGYKEENSGLPYGVHVGRGSVFANFGDLKIESSNFTDNYAGEKGGTIYNEGNLTINNSLFDNNLANAYGGAISSKYHRVIENNVEKYISSNIQITNTIFNNNRVELPSMNYGDVTGGGAIHINQADAFIKNCTFENNMATTSVTGIMGISADGGSIAIEKDTGKITNATIHIENSTFTNHTTNIITNGKLRMDSLNGIITNCIFENNQGTTQDVTTGLIKDVGNLNITYSTFKNNSNYDTIIYTNIHDEQIKTISNNQFIDNKLTQETIYKYISTDYIQGDIINITVSDNTYTNTTIDDTLTLNVPNKIYTGEPITITGTYTLNTPENYDADILEQTKFNVYINGELDQTIDTLEFTVTPTAGNMIITVQPTISQTRKSTSIRPTTLTNIIITPENYSEYIYEGALIGVSKDSKIIFQGMFQDKGNIAIDTPDIILDGTDAQFTNTVFKLESTGITIQNMDINNSQTDYPIINTADNNIITQNTITLTNANGKTAAIYNKASNTEITYNTLYVDGPAIDIDHSEGYGIANTQAILLIGGDKNKVEYNTVKVTTTGTSTQFGTTEAITNHKEATNTIISNNNITLTGNAKFKYGINSLNNIENITITNNNIQVTGERYTDGIQIGTGANNILIKDNNIKCVCQNTTPVDEEAITYGITTVTVGGIISNNITIQDNNIDLTGTANYGIELYTTNNTLVENNTINVNGPQSMGIGLAHSPNSTIIGNNIKTNGDSTIPLGTVTEEIQPANAGIQVQQDSNNILIQDNTIQTYDKAGKDNCINITTNNVTVKDNNLTSSTKTGDNTITTKNITTTTIEDNTAIEQNSTTQTTTEDLTIGESTTITAQFYDDTYTPVGEGKAIFRVNGKTLRDNQGNVIYADVINGRAELPDVNITQEWTKEGTTIQAVYMGDENTDSIITEKTPITVTKPEATITLETPAPATAGQTITLKATVTDGENNINTGRVAFKLNGKTLKNAEGKALYAEVKDSIATITYTIPEKTKAKEYTLTAVFTDTNYDRVEAESKLNVVKA